MAAIPARNDDDANGSERPGFGPKTGSHAYDRLVVASELAAFCKADLKTIHNWVGRGHIRCFRTPGRHLRFRVADVVQFLRRFGFAVPRTLETALPRPVVVVGSSKTFDLVTRALGDGGDTPRHLEHPYDAVILAGVEPAGIYVVEVGTVPASTLGAMLNALHRASPHSTLVAMGSDRIRLPEFAVFVERDAKALRAVLNVGADAEAPTPRGRD